MYTVGEDEEYEEAELKSRERHVCCHDKSWSRTRSENGLKEIGQKGCHEECGFRCARILQRVIRARLERILID